MTTEQVSTDPGPVWLLDANVLLALTVATHIHHAPAHAALRDCSAFATCPTTEAALLRLVLNPAVTGVRHSGTQALGILRGLRSDPRWTFIPDHTSLTEPALDTSVLVGHRQVTDLQLVNLAAVHGAVLATLDSSLRRSLAPDDRRHVRVLPIE